MIAGLEEITDGDLYIDDKLVNNVAPKDRDIAMVFQNYALYPHMPVYDNMAFGLKLRKVPKAEIDQRVKEAARILGIEQYLTRKPKALSGGQRQRVALGRAIVREPKVFLLDEPLSNLDAKLRAQMRTEISKLHQRLGTTFIYVTHDQTEAMTMASRIVVMKSGVIQQVDTPQNLYLYPCNLFVAGFIGTPQMNFVEAKLLEEKGTFFLNLSGQLIGWATTRFQTEENSCETIIMPISEYKGVLQKLSNGVAIPYFGIMGLEVSTGMQTEGIPKGIYITESIAEGPAYLAGIQNGDILTKIQGQEILTIRDFQNRIESLESDVEILVTIARKGIDAYKEIEYRVTMGAR